jgi:hypothetical protein
MADSTKAKKNYVKGSSKLVTFSNGGEIINLDLKIEGKIIGSQGDILPNKAGYAKISLNKLEKADEYGNTHSIYENTFKPESKGEIAAPSNTRGKITPAKAKISSPTTDDMPF